MLVTSEEAKAKNCCGQATFATVFLALTADAAVPVASGQWPKKDQGNMPKCTGDACMAWRSAGTRRVGCCGEERLGYCGLAGKP
jgi:hypothetical protein